MADHSDFSLALPFDTDDSQFVRGVEVGRVWALLGEHPDQELEFTVHNVNAEMMLRMAEATNRAIHSEEIDDTWTEVFFDAPLDDH